MRRRPASAAGLLLGALLAGCAFESTTASPGNVDPAGSSPGVRSEPVAGLPPLWSVLDVTEAARPRAAPAGSVVSLATGLDEADDADVAPPSRIEIDRLGVSSDLDVVGLDSGGVLEAPPRWNRAGWFDGGPRPGERGPAVIAGHLDSPTGAAVFAALPDIRPGDEVVVTDRAGERHVFAVSRLDRTPKRGFPTREVYGAVPGSELRLITCTGEYRSDEGGYQDNLLVFATLVK